MDQLIVTPIPSTMHHLDNFAGSYDFFTNRKSAGDSNILLAQGWEPSVSISGAFGIFQKVQLYTAPDAEHFVFALETDVAVLWDRNTIVFPFYAAKLTIPVVASGMSGVSVLSVSDNNGAGTGTLTYTATGTTLKWTAPGGTAGAAVDVHLNGDYVLHDGTDTTKTITVRVVGASLPGGNTTQNFTTAVANLNAVFYSERRHR